MYNYLLIINSIVIHSINGDEVIRRVAVIRITIASYRTMHADVAFDILIYK